MSGHTPWSEVKRKMYQQKELTVTKSKRESVKLDELIVDHDVQRSLNNNRVDSLVNDFRPDGLGVITVSRRDDGTLHVVDGQHRVYAVRAFNARKAQPPINTMEATVYSGLSVSDEALLFRVLNNTKRVGTYDRFKVRLVEGDLTAVELDKSLKMYGWHVSPNKLRDGKGGFQAVAALEWVYRGADLTDPPAADQLGNVASVRSLLNIVTSAWGHDAEGVREDIVKGLGKFLIRYGDRIDLAKLTSELAKTSPLQLHSDGKLIRSIRSLPAADAIADILTGLYNKKRTVHRLPEWRSGKRWWTEESAEV